MAVTFYNLNSDAGLKKLDEYLFKRSYITGYQASKDDITVYSSLPKPPSSVYVNASRWYKHIDALLRISGVSGEGCGVIIEGSAPIPAGMVTPPAADTKAVEERVAVIKASSITKESGKSSVLLDVKPWDGETDMKKLEEVVRSVSMEGLLWGASKLVPVRSGIKKLRIMLTIVDDLVSVDELIENYLTVEPVNEYVQSCDLVACHKICNSWRVPSISIGANGSSRVFEKVQTTKRTFAETGTKAPRFGDEVMEEAGVINWFEEEILVESDSEDDGEEEESRDGIPVIKFPKEMRKKFIQPWKNALILKFPGKRINFPVFKRKLLRMWAPQGRLEVIDLGYKFYITRFELEKDCMRVLFQGPWKVFDRYVVLQRWKPNFDQANTKAENMAICVRLPGLSMESFSEDIIKHILYQVGTPLKLDRTTAGVERGCFVRAVIEIDLSKPLVSTVNIGSKIQNIEFEGLHAICFGCGEVSHLSNDCPKKPHEQPQDKQPQNNSMYGPWMLVQPKGKTRTVSKKKQAGSNRTSVANRFTAI